MSSRLGRLSAVTVGGGLPQTKPPNAPKQGGVAACRACVSVGACVAGDLCVPRRVGFLHL